MDSVRDIAAGMVAFGLGGDRAVSAYVAQYFIRPGLDTLPVAVQAPVFDFYIQAGSGAVKILQRLCTDMGYPAYPDGRVGAQTVASAHAAHAAAPGHFADAYGIARRCYCYALAEARPQSRINARAPDGGKGPWIARAEAFIAPRHHLGPAAHHALVAHWG